MSETSAPSRQSSSVRRGAMGGAVGLAFPIVALCSGVAIQRARESNPVGDPLTTALAIGVVTAAAGAVGAGIGAVVGRVHEKRSRPIETAS